ncbi:MAG: lytic murein transglycosylase [bacterium]|nr:lytic murein transglycosylase [bacterium]
MAILGVVSFMLGSVQAPGQVAAQEDQGVAEQTAETTPTTKEQRSELEAQLTELETQIAEHQKTIASYQKQGKSLSGEISSLNAKINKLNLQIKAVNLNISQLEKDTAATQRTIVSTENRIVVHKDAISRAVRNLYESDREPLLAVLVGNARLSDFFGNIENVMLVQSSLRNSLAEITKLREQLLDQKQELALEREDTENLKVIQEAQKRGVQSTQTQKATLLKTTKGKEAEYQKILTKTKEEAAQIRNRIFELLGGGELTFEKAYEYAKLAGGAAGIRPALILGILNRESLLGKNTGRCAYDQVMKGGTTAMNPKDHAYFLELTGGLGIDPHSAFARISCPNQDGTYGGAMGPAQFIPSTWKIYSPEITRITGSEPANPWNNSDAFTGTALYLEDNGAAAQTAAAEKKASATYYCGSRWQRSACQFYASKVLEAAAGFQDDIEVLEQAKQPAGGGSTSPSQSNG